MTYEDHEFAILELAERGALPQSIIDDSIAPRTVLKRMVEEELMAGSVADFDFDPDESKTQFAGLRITSVGRHRLSEIRSVRKQQRPVARIHRASLVAWRVVVAIVTIIGLVLGILISWRKLHEPAPALPLPTPTVTSSPRTPPIPPPSPSPSPSPSPQ